eukprot:761850-Hanusia_phi.AAC.1
MRTNSGRGRRGGGGQQEGGGGQQEEVRGDASDLEPVERNHGLIPQGNLTPRHPQQLPQLLPTCLAK